LQIKGKRAMMQRLLTYLLGAVGIYFCYCLLLFVMQRQMLFPRGMIGTPPEPQTATGSMERIWIETGSETVEAWYLPPAAGTSDGPAPVVIFGHGNGELIDFWPMELDVINRLGMGLLLVEYPGYGRSGGKPSQASITRTFVAAYDTIVGRSSVDKNRIVLFGRSLGGAAVCALAEKRPSGALILMSAFTGVRAFAKKYGVPGLFIRDPLDNLSVVRDYPGPLLIVHGSRDDIIPYDHGRKLHASAKNSRLITYSAGHNDCPPDWGIFWQDLEEFLKETGILASSPHPPGKPLPPRDNDN
jgi:uncharacterized protein